MPEKEELQAACAALVGCLDRCAAAGVQKTFAARLSQEVAAFYALVFSELDADEDLAELRAEDFDHFPPKAKNQL